MVVEFPASRPRAPRHQDFGPRSALSLPSYGVAVGAVFMQAVLHTPGRVLTPASDEWPSRSVPRTAGDAHKEGRVRYVEGLYGLERGALGPKTRAGNVADAVLLAMWGLFRLPALQVPA